MANDDIKILLKPIIINIENLIDTEPRTYNIKCRRGLSILLKKGLNFKIEETN